ncbi:hypothetical protein GCM10023093_20500 [Nemorincola caseinilytica]|uniref:Uncharacterized protein n=1 Tax=Nemorincola caseinilytica TaxID=2054315 RepID=A0ABP8NFD0_9BACT
MKVNIGHINNTHGQWLRTLGFYRTEIAILKSILTEIAGKYTDTGVMKEVEHFENQFRVQNNNIDILSHDIHANISKIAQQAQASSAGYIDGALQTEHAALGTRTDDQEKISSALVHEFRKFAERWM